VQLTVSAEGWLTPPVQLPILAQVFVCWPDDGQVEGDSVYVQLLSVQDDGIGVGVYEPSSGQR